MEIMNSAEPSNLYIVGKVLMRAIQKCNFFKNLSNCVKSYGHLCQFYQNHSSNMVMSHDPGLRFPKFDLPNSVLNFGKVTKFGGIGPRTKMLQTKTNWVVPKCL